jgi:Rrf2 family protein
MKITALEEYGLRCLVQLARHAPGTPLSAREIAAAEGLTVEYVTQLLVRLRQAGLVRSVRGSRGGFHLTRPPADLTMGDVTRALGEPLLDRLCASYTGTRATCIHQGSACGILDFWSDIAGKVHGVLDGYTLEDLARRMEAAPPEGAAPAAPRATPV